MWSIKDLLLGREYFEDCLVLVSLPWPILNFFLGRTGKIPAAYCLLFDGNKVDLKPFFLILGVFDGKGRLDFPFTFLTEDLLPCQLLLTIEETLGLRRFTPPLALFFAAVVLPALELLPYDLVDLTFLLLIRARNLLVPGIFSDEDLGLFSLDLLLLRELSRTLCLSFCSFMVKQKLHKKYSTATR